MSFAYDRSDQEQDRTELAQKRVDDQVLLIEQLHKEGSDTQSAERLLAIYREVLDALKD